MNERIVKKTKDDEDEEEKEAQRALEQGERMKVARVLLTNWSSGCVCVCVQWL